MSDFNTQKVMGTDGKPTEIRVLTAEAQLERAELAKDVTSQSLRRRALENGASRNGHGPASDVHP